MVIIAHNIRSLHNVGAIFRSADCFAAERIYLTGFTGTPPRPEIAKVALGAEDRVAWEAGEIFEVIDALKKAGYRIIALDNRPGAEPIAPVDEKVALLLGNEVDGIESTVLALCDATVEISMPGRKRSLNVAVATGIALFVLSATSGKMKAIC